MSHDDPSPDGPDGGPITLPPATAADLARVLHGLDDPTAPLAGPADLAALIEGRLTGAEADGVLGSADARARAEAAADFMAEVAARSDSPPASLMQAARELLAPAPPRPSADIVQLRPGAPVGAPVAAPVAANDIEVFQLMAAASKADDASIVCRSQSGIWTLEVFSGQSPEDRAAGNGVLLLSVHPEHQASYEGRTARVFVIDAGAERVLAEGRIEGGELYADIVLTGLDLRRRDAINVVFGPAPAGG
jgi:hypothetical protein